MRLTLRTLLAYLDNTLEADDAKALQEKLAESGFATQLVQRIRSMLVSDSLSAPSPDAIGPVEEANVISEYLDSTLPAEQVAEIERACLESDPHLAEAAACHQVLTMVLGKPAEVSPELRERIYELPDRRIDDIAAAGSFSAVAIPPEEPPLNLNDAIPTGEVSSLGGQPVTPVGVADSGVSDAPTRLRESGTIDDPIAGKQQAIAGSRQRSMEDSRIYGGSIRPSRIAPWLVFLGLSAVLLFALTRIFKPLLNPEPVASIDSMTTAELLEEIEVSPEDAPMMMELPVEPAGDSEKVSLDELPAPSGSAESIEGVAAPDGMAQNDGNVSEGANVSERESANSNVGDPEEMPAPDLPPSDPPAVSITPPSPSEPGDVPDGNSLAEPTVPEMVEAEEPPVSPAADEVQPNTEVAKIASDDGLMAATTGQQWMRLKKNMVLKSGVTVMTAPTFRGQMATDSALITVVGPAQVHWEATSDGNLLRLDYGRIVVAAKQPDAKLNLQLGDQFVPLLISEAESVAAVNVTYFRAPGFDPLKPENRVPLYGLLSVQGQIGLGGQANDGADVTLETGQQWVQRGSAKAQVSPVQATPNWVDAPDPVTASSLEAGARTTLLELLEGEQPFEIALREATLFRHAEVVSLAAQTLLNLGRGDVYFSGDGILSDPKQRAYWPDHFAALLAVIDRDADSAAQIRESIESMDSANTNALFRLLAGYSQKQLVEGGDEELVDLLDSTSMAVRVLALENLERITGTRLYFRADQDNAVRRAPGIKKWDVRQRKGDIRWSEGE